MYMRRDRGHQSLMIDEALHKTNASEK
jgi:hypothetical protein